MYCVERQNSLSSRCPQKRWVLIFLFSSWRHTLNICSSQSTLQMQASLSMSILKTINWSAPEMKVTNVLGWGSRGKNERKNGNQEFLAATTICTWGEWFHPQYVLKEELSVDGEIFVCLLDIFFLTWRLLKMNTRVRICLTGFSDCSYTQSVTSAGAGATPPQNKLLFRIFEISLKEWQCIFINPKSPMIDR